MEPEELGKVRPTTLL